MILLRIVMAVVAVGQVDSGHEIRLTDMPGYREALTPTQGKTPPAVRPVTFHDLWERAEQYRGRRIRVEGRVVQRFDQGAIGAFPALTELWIVSPSQDPFCLVYPTRDNDAATLSTGATARFDGTFIKQIQYQARDAKRLAPLVVGPSPPTTFADDPLAGILPSIPFGWLDVFVGLGVAGLVVVILFGMKLRAPVHTRMPIGGVETSPQFVDREEG